jgi:hypothetical protein
MDADPLPELAAVRTLIETSDLSSEARHTALWCLGQLPRTYHELLRTQEQRFADAIQGHARAVLRHLHEHGGAGVAEGFVAHLHALHGRLGLRPLNFKPVSPVASRRRPSRRG